MTWWAWLLALLAVLGADVSGPIDDQTAAEFAAAIENPVSFARGVLGDDLWPKQEEVLRALARPHARVAVKACHSSGKTRVAADAAVWFPTCFEDGLVVTTAPTWPQVELLLWGEMHAALGRAQIAYPEANKTEWFLSRTNYAVGLSTNEGVRFQGFHAPHLLFILDEAPGVRPDIYEAIEGARAGGDVRVLALGNPTIASGPFYNAFDRDRANWTTITISAFDTPNFVGLPLEQLCALPREHPDLEVGTRPYLTTRRWVREKWDEWGRHHHPSWQARVLGLFPPQAPDALLSLSWLEVARLTLAVDDGGEFVAGIDVAGPGEDETALALRCRSAVLLERSWANPDPRGELLATLLPYKGRLRHVNVDTVGIGYYLGKHLEDAGLPVRYVNVGESASDPERYKNAKAEHYWGLRMRFEASDVRGALTDETVTQLAGIRWRTNARGQIEIESKDEARKRGVKSPDKAEAIMLCFATPKVSGFLDFITDDMRRRAAMAAAGEGEAA